MITLEEKILGFHIHLVSKYSKCICISLSIMDYMAEHRTELTFSVLHELLDVLDMNNESITAHCDGMDQIIFQRHVSKFSCKAKDNFESIEPSEPYFHWIPTNETRCSRLKHSSTFIVSSRAKIK